MDRRAILAVGSTLIAYPTLLVAQAKADPRWRIGNLTQAPLTSSGECTRGKPGEHFLETLQGFGYVEERNFVRVLRCAGGRPERLPDQARQLVDAKVDLILAWGTEPIAAAKRATDRIPIVMVYGPDPVALGWARSFARPGGNLTGLTWELDAEASIGLKHLELIRESLPGARRIGFIEQPNPLLEKSYRPTYLGVAKNLGLEIHWPIIKNAAAFEEVFRQLRATGTDVLIIASDTLTVPNMNTILELVSRGRFPAVMWAGEELVADRPGALLYYGAHTADQPRRAAVFVDKILKGAKPGDLPIERPVKTDLVVDLRVARTLGLKIPQAVLLRATRVIE